MDYAMLDIRHPGFFIREELEAREWTQRDLAFVLGTSEQAVNTIIAGRRGISPDMARALGDAFNVNPEFFANLQRAYDMSRARDPDPGVAKRARMQSVYPLREMIKRGWLEDIDPSMLEAQLARFFFVDSADEVPHLDHAAKKSNYDEVEPSQLAWLFRAKQLAASIPYADYSEAKLREALQALKPLATDPEETRQVPQILAEAGVRFVLVEGLPGAKIDGACFWLNNNASPVIAMSLRFDRIDNFWFVLLHEIEHVLRKHGRTREIIDEDLSPGAESVNEEERVANAAAASFCIPPSELISFVARKAPFFSERDVVGFARRLQIHPGIAVGQIQNVTKRWDLLRRYQVKVRQFVIPSAITDGWGNAADVTL